MKIQVSTVKQSENGSTVLGLLADGKLVGVFIKYRKTWISLDKKKFGRLFLNKISKKGKVK